MPTNSVTGLNSGIDINSLVDSLVTMQTKPALNSIQRQETDVITKLTATGNLKGTLSDLKTMIDKLTTVSAFNPRLANSSDNNTVQISANPASTQGVYTIQVNQLALAQKSITTLEYPNADAIVGSGVMTFTSGDGKTFDAVVDGDGSLGNIKDSINKAAHNFGITASIINVDSTLNPGTTISKLVLTSNQTGIANGFTQTGSLSLTLSTQTSPLDAIISIDGQTATRSTNQITDVLDGAVINLQKSSPGIDIKLTIQQDTNAITNNLNAFISAYNNWSKAMNDYTFIGTNGAQSGALANDAATRNLISRVRTDITSPISSITSDYNSLSFIGITVDRAGEMSLNTNVLKQALVHDSNAVANIFTSATDGLNTKLNSSLMSFLGTDGILTYQQSSLNKQLNELDSKKAEVLERADKFKANYLKQFNHMDAIMGQYKTISSYLSNALNPPQPKE